MISAKQTTGKILRVVPAAVAVLFFSSLQAGDEKKLRSGLLFDGSYERAPITRKIDGAKNTQLVAAYEWDYGVKHFSKEKWDKNKHDWNSFFPEAKKLADEIAGKLKPEFVRDSRGIIDYAIIRDKDPFLSSAILSKNFLKLFEATLGDHLNVIIIDRNLLYIFPAAGGKLADYGPAIARQFRNAKLRVSLEIFLIDKKGFRVIGELERE